MLKLHEIVDSTVVEPNLDFAHIVNTIFWMPCIVMPLLRRPIFIVTWQKLKFYYSRCVFLLLFVFTSSEILGSRNSCLQEIATLGYRCALNVCCDLTRFHITLHMTCTVPALFCGNFINISFSVLNFKSFSPYNNYKKIFFSCHVNRYNFLPGFCWDFAFSPHCICILISPFCCNYKTTRDGICNYPNEITVKLCSSYRCSSKLSLTSHL